MDVKCSTRALAGCSWCSLARVAGARSAGGGKVCFELEISRGSLGLLRNEYLRRARRSKVAQTRACERERQGEGGEGAVAPIPPEPGSRGDTWEPMGVPDEIAPSGAMPSTGRGVLAEQRLNASPLQPVDLLEVDDMVGRAGVDRQLRV